jgi:uncharacterized membrane protein
MKDRVSHSIGVLKTTAIGGIFFLLPLIVVGALIGQTLQIVWVVAQSVHDYLPVKSPFGYSLLLAAAVLLLLLLCFAAGVAAKRSLGKQFTESIEKYLLMLFPRYAIFKEQLTGNIGGDVLHNRLKPVMVSMPEGKRLGMEVERSDSADSPEKAVWVTVFLPGSPDPWSGSVVIVDVNHVQRLEIPFAEAIATAEQLGRGTLRLIDMQKTDLSPPT